MARASNFALRLQGSLLEEVKEAAAREGASVNQFINVAVAEKLATLRTLEFFRERAVRADVARFRDILDRTGCEPPREGDEIPEGFEKSDIHKRHTGERN